MGTLFLFSALIASAVAGPLSPRSECARHCTESNKFGYEPGTVYTYNYESRTTTTMQGTLHDETSLHMQAVVDFEVLSKCEIGLRLRDVSLEAPHRDEEFKTLLERHLLKFSFQDGKIDSICSTQGDPKWVVNIKRGILSAFQTSLENLETSEKLLEVDVAGRCSADYQSLGRNWGNTLTIRKSKDFTSCLERSSSYSSFQFSPLAHNMKIQSLPLIKGIQDCEQSFKNNILLKSACSESHEFKPFSNQKSSAVTKSIQTLTFYDDSRNSFVGNDYRPTVSGSLLFDHSYDEMEANVNKKEAEERLSLLCSNSQDDIRPKVPELFSEFVYTLRKLDYATLKSIYSQTEAICRGNTKAKRFFLDALPMVGSSGSVKMMVDLISTKQINGGEEEFWFTSMAFYKNPTVEMIGTLKNSIQGQNSKSALLGISALVHTFCEGKEECNSIPEVKEIILKLVSNLGENCYQRDPETVLLSLKAIGNIGTIKEAEQILKRCFANPQNEIEIRLAAIQAFRRFSCEIKRDELLSLYKNTNENVELRIASYLSSVTCLNPETIQIIKQSLETETINQVGSFVWSHLSTLGRSEFQDILSNLRLITKYNSDARKYSKAISESLFFDSISTGLHADSDIIFSPESYLPRSALLNLTFDIFGQSINFFEIGGRMEGFEDFVERIFGPEGYLPQNKVHQFLETLRNKRSISDNKIDEFEQAFDKSRLNKDPLASMYLKIFGNELFYSRLSNMKMFSILDILKELAHDQDIEINKNIMFLDGTYTLPVGSGFPLKLALNGSAAISLKMGGKFDVRSFKQVDVRGRLQPSGAITISALMTVDAGVIKTGMKMEATLHSSTLMDGVVEVHNGKIAKAQLSVPRDQMEIFDIQSHVYQVNGKEIRRANREDNVERNTKCSREFLGLKLCSTLVTPLISGPNGEIIAKVILHKTDPTLTSYNLDASWGKTDQRTGVSVTLNTPRSSVNRELSASFDYNAIDNTFLIKLYSPNKKFDIKGLLTLNDDMKKGKLAFILDDTELFSIDSDIKITNKNGEYGLTPAIQIRGPKGRLFSLIGNAHYVQDKKFITQITVEDITEKPIIYRADIDIKNGRYSGDIKVESPYLETGVQGYVSTVKDSLTSKLSFHYKIGQQRKHTIDTVMKFRDLSASTLTKYSGTGSVQSSQWPQLSSSATWEMQVTNGHLENTLQLTLGDARRGRVHKIVAQEIIRYQNTPEKKTAAVTLKFTYPEKSMEYSFDMKHENTMSSLNNRINLQYAPGKTIATIVDLSYDFSKKIYMKEDIQIQLPSREIKLMATIDEVKAKQFQLSSNIQWERGQQVKLVSNYHDKSTSDKNIHHIDVEITLPKKRSISFSSNLDFNNKQYLLTGDMDLFGSKYKFNGEYYLASIRNQEFSGQLNIPGSFYSANGILNIEVNKFLVTFDLKLDNVRQIKSKIDIKKETNLIMATLEAIWESQQIQKRLSLVGEVKNTNSDCQVMLNLDSPIKTAQITYAGRIDRGSSGTFISIQNLDITWDEVKKISTSLSLENKRDSNTYSNLLSIFIKTPFTNYEKQSFYIKNDLTTDASSLSKLELTLNAESSYANYKNFEYVLSLENKSSRNGPKEYKCNTHLSINSNNVAKFETSTKFGKKFYQVELYLTSEAKNLQQAKFNWEHSYTDKSGVIKTEGQYNNKSPITVKINALKKSARAYELTTEITTPFENYETMSSNMNAQYGDSNMVAKVELVKNQKKMSGEYDLKYSKQNVEAKVIFRSDIRNYEAIQTRLKYTIKDDAFNGNIQMELRSRRYAATISSKFPSLRNIEVNFNSETPFSNAQKIDSSFVHSMSENNIQTILEGNVDSKKFVAKLTGSHSLSRNNGKTKGSIEITTPFNGYESIKAALDYNRENKMVFNTVVSASINRKEFAFEHNLKVTDILNFNNAIQIRPLFNLKDVSIVTTQEKGPGKFSHKSFVEWGDNKKISLTSELTNNSPRSDREINSFIKIESPYKFKSIELRGKYSMIRNSGDSQIYSPIIRLEVDDGRTIHFGNLEGTLNNRNFRFVDSSITLTSSFNSFKSNILTAKYDIISDKKTFEINGEWDRSSKKISLEGYCQGNFKNMETKVTLDFPFETLKYFNTYIKYNVESNEKSGTMNIKWTRQQEKFIQLDASATPMKEVKFDMLSNIENFESFKFQSSYDSSERKIDSTLSWSPSNFVELKAVIPSLKDKKYDLNLNLKSSFRNAKDLSLIGNLINQKNIKEGRLTYQWTRQDKIVLESKIDLSSRTVNMMFTSPFEGLKKHTLYLNYNIKEKMIDFNYKWQEKEIRTFLKIEGNKKSGSLDFNLQTPFSLKNVKTTAKYGLFETEKNSDLFIQWNENKPLKFQGNFVLDKGMAHFTSTFESHFAEKITISVKGQSMNPKFQLDGEFKWGSAQFLNLNAEAELIPQLKLSSSVKITSSRKQIEDVFYVLNVNRFENELSGATTLELGGSKKINLEMSLMKNNILFILETPFKQYKLLRFNAKSTKDSFLADYLEHQVAIEMLLNSQIIEFASEVTQKKEGKILEAKVSFKSPFKNFKRILLETSIKKEGSTLFDVTFNAQIPYKKLETIVFVTKLTKTNNYELVFDLNTPIQTLTTVANFYNKNLEPLEFALTVDSPTTFLKKISLKTFLNYKGIKDIKGEFSLEREGRVHSLSVSEQTSDISSVATVIVLSPLLEDKRITGHYSVNYKNLKEISGLFKIDTIKHSHKMTTSYKKIRDTYEAMVKFECPYLKDNELTIKSKLKNGAEKQLDFGVTSPSSKHELFSTFQMEADSIAAKASVNCPLMSTRPMSFELNAKKQSGNYEMTSKLITPKQDHTLSGSLKTFNGEMLGNLKIESPLFKAKYLEISSNFKNENMEKIDGSFEVATGAKSFRVSGNMKRSKWDNLEAFFTLNTPMRSLSMARIDIKFSKIQNEAFEGSVFLKTDNIPELGINGKLFFKPDINKGDISLSLTLPTERFHKTNFLAHYSANEMMNGSPKINARATLTLSDDTYSIFFSKEKRQKDQIAANSGCEWNNNKIQLQSVIQIRGVKGIQLVLETPFEQHKKYELYFTSRNESEDLMANSKYDLTLTLPDSKQLKLDAGVICAEYKNCQLKFKTRSFFKGYETVEGDYKINSNNDNYNVMLALKAPRKSYNLNIIQEIIGNKYTANIEIRSSYDRLKSFTIRSNGEFGEETIKRANGEIEYNGNIYYKTESAINTDGSLYSITEFPRIPFTSKIEIKSISSGKEMEMTMKTSQRTVSIKSSLQNSPQFFRKTLGLSLNNGIELSYDVRIMTSANSKKELVARVNFPRRSVELKATGINSDHLKSLKTEFFWDVINDPQKQVSMEINHEDLSAWNNKIYKTKILLKHYKVAKPIIMKSQLSSNTEEKFGRIEIDFGKSPSDKLDFEARVKTIGSQTGQQHYIISSSLVHLPSELDIKVDGEMANQPNSFIYNMKVNYLLSQKRREAREIKLNVDKLKKEADVYAKYNEDVHKLSLKTFDKDNQLAYRLEHVLNNNVPHQSYFSLNKRQRTLDMTVTLSEGKSIHLQAKNPKESIQFTIKRSSKVEPDVKAFLGLEDSNHLKSSLSWNPNLVKEIQDQYNGFIVSIKGHTSGFPRNIEISPEINRKINLFIQSLPQDLKAVRSDISAEIESIRQDIKAFTSVVSRMYRNNEFYMKDIGNELYIAGQSFIAAYEQMGKNLNIYSRRMYNILTDSLMGRYKIVINILNNWKINVKQYASEIPSALQTMTTNMIDLMYSYSPKWIGKMRNYVSERYVEFAAKMNKQLTNNKVVIFIQNYIARVRARIVALQNKHFDGTFMRQISEKLIYFLDNAKNHPSVLYVSDLTSKTMDQGFQAYRRFGVDILYEEALRKVNTFFWSAMRQVTDEYANINKYIVYNFKPEIGRADLSIRLLSPRNSLSELLDVYNSPEFKRIKTLKERYLYEEFSMWDIYYKYKRVFMPSFWIMPFSTHSMIVGDQHFMTFDKKYYDFKGECSYLLTHDFLDRNFSAWINYGTKDNRVYKKSITVLSDGKQIELGTDYKLTLDDVKVEFPVEFGKTIVKRVGSVVSVENQLGFKVECNFIHEFCTFHTSGFYFGRTAGLLGTYDNEQSLDFMTPDRRLVNSVDDFSKSWQMRNCRGGNMALIPANDYRANKMCTDLFKKQDSILRNCFKQVDPEPFIRMCMTDLSNADDYDTKICSSAAAYRAECELVGVPLRMPSSCVKCPKANGDFMKEGEAIRFDSSNSSNSADIVYIIEEKDCNVDVIKTMTKLAQGVEDAFAEKGYRNIRHAVVGFGGSSSHEQPHIQTIDGLEFGSVRSIDSAFSNLVTGSGSANIFEAIRFAASLPFRAGVTKSFVLVKCTECTSEKFKADYSEMFRTLLDNDIQLHLMMNQEFTFKSQLKKLKTKRVLGLDRNAVFTTKDIRYLTGDKDLLSQVKVPKDLCVPLSLEVEGSLFSSKMLTETKGNINKKLIDIMTRKMAKSSKVPECQICECIATGDGVGKSTCQSCVARDFDRMTVDPEESQVFWQDVSSEDELELSRSANRRF